MDTITLLQNKTRDSVSTQDKRTEKTRPFHLSLAQDKHGMLVHDIKGWMHVDEAKVLWHTIQMYDNCLELGTYQGLSTSIIAQANPDCNITTVEIFEENKPENLMITSSSCVYKDDGPETISERDLFEGNPENVNRGYGWAKRFLECKTKILSEETGIKSIIVRPFNIYGERYKWRGEGSQAIPMLVSKILSNLIILTSILNGCTSFRILSTFLLILSLLKSLFSSRCFRSRCVFVFVSSSSS